jgi:hypothetical protein
MFVTIAIPGEGSRGVSVTLRREGWGECCGYSEVSVWPHLCRLRARRFGPNGMP